MTHCLVTFLGRPLRENGNGEYKRLDYQFSDGHAARAAFLGFPLRDWLKADRLVVFGTAGSMWDHLFEGDLTIEGNDNERLALMEEVADASVTQPRLDMLAPQLAAYLDCDVQLKIIPTALEAADQQQLLHMLAGAAEGADCLSIDVTHGFRHLPMLAVTAALCLRVIRPELRIEGLWYGELGSGTVHNLDGLLETADWLAALQRNEWLGDYDGIADLVEDGDAELADHLRAATFHESIHQARQARGNIRNARSLLKADSLHGPGALFQPTLLQRMSWVDEDTLYLRQRRNALDALERNDYLRASLYGFEAFVTRLVQDPEFGGKSSADTKKPDTREEARTKFRSEHQSKDIWDAYTLLRQLRNVLAHGNTAEGKSAQNAIHSANNLRTALRRSFDKLLPEQQQ